MNCWEGESWLVEPSKWCDHVTKVVLLLYWQCFHFIQMRVMYGIFLQLVEGMH